jgi:hypothetical protein
MHPLLVFQQLISCWTACLLPQVWNQLALEKATTLSASVPLPLVATPIASAVIAESRRRRPRLIKHYRQKGEADPLSDERIRLCVLKLATSFDDLGEPVLVPPPPEPEPRLETFPDDLEVCGLSAHPCLSEEVRLLTTMMISSTQEFFNSGQMSGCGAAPRQVISAERSDLDSAAAAALASAVLNVEVCGECVGKLWSDRGVVFSSRYRLRASASGSRMRTRTTSTAAAISTRTSRRKTPTHARPEPSQRFDVW